MKINIFAASNKYIFRMVMLEISIDKKNFILGTKGDK